MKRLAVFALAIAGIIAGAIGVAPTITTALPPGVVPGPNSITGTVTDQNGQPLADVFMIDSTFTFFTTTDLDGTYLLDGLTAGTEYSVIAADQTGTYPQVQSNPVIASDSGPVVVDFALQPFPTSSVSGTVTDENGVPLTGIVIRDLFNSSAAATTGADGRYTIDGLRVDQSHQFSAEDPAGLHRSAFSDFINVAADGTSVVDFTLTAFPIAATGVVTDPDGLPVEGVQVNVIEFGSTPVTTGPDGRFTLAFDVAPNGAYTLSIDPRFARPDLRPVNVPVVFTAGSTTDASVQLSRFPTIDATVTAGGAPADAVVALWSDGPFPQVVARRPVGPDGTVSLAVPADGDYFLQVEPQNAEFASEFFPDSVFSAAAQRFSIVGEQHVPVAIDLERAATISGTITNSDGTLGDFSQVTAFPVGQPENQIFESTVCNLPFPDDPPGTYRVGCLHPSVDWVVKGFGNGASDNGYYLDSQSAFNATPIAVDPGQAVTGIDLHLRRKSPNPTVTAISQQYFISGTTTPGVHVFGTNFPADLHAISLTAESGAFTSPDIRLAVTSVISPNELVATVTVDPAVIGQFPIFKSLVITTSIGGVFEGGPEVFVGDSTTPVATISGRVTDDRGKGIGNVVVTATNTTADVFGTFRRVTAVTGPDGTWRAQGISPGTYTVKFEGTEKYNAQFWKQRTTQATATPLTLANGDVRTGINAVLALRGPIKVLSASPKLQVPNLSFDLVGQGLGSIRGGFRVSISTAFGAFPLQSESVSSSKLHVTGFAFPGTWDIVTQWTADDGTVKSTTCVGCIKVYDNLSAFSFDNFVLPGTTATINYFGSGLVDITKVTVGGKDVKVLSYTAGGGGIAITFQVKKGAALGSRPVTITRIDGRSTTTDMVVGSFF